MTALRSGLTHSGLAKGGLQFPVVLTTNEFLAGGTIRCKTLKITERDRERKKNAVPNKIWK